MRHNTSHMTSHMIQQRGRRGGTSKACSMRQAHLQWVAASLCVYVDLRWASREALYTVALHSGSAGGRAGALQVVMDVGACVGAPSQVSGGAASPPRWGTVLKYTTVRSSLPVTCPYSTIKTTTPSRKCRLP